ncbi:FAD-binding protein [Nitrospinota bacterium]
MRFEASARHLETDVLIIGAGAAGMVAALGCVRGGVKPLLVTKGTFPSGSTSKVRGGFSVALGHVVPEDEPLLMFKDSVTASLPGARRRSLAL